MNNGGYRDSLALNIPLIQDKLAIYGAQAYTSLGFQQQPSYDITRREYAAFTSALPPAANPRSRSRPSSSA